MAQPTNPSVDELEKKEEDLFRTGPLSVLTMSVKSNSQVRRSMFRAPRHAWYSVGSPVGGLS